MKPIKVAMIGVGNCASSLVQGVSYYRQNNSSQGLIHDKIGGYGAGDVDFVLGIDVDARKVGKDISEAIFAAPNNTKVFQQDVRPTGAKVIMGLVSDGVAAHMTTVGEKGFIVADAPEATKESIIQAIKDSGAEVLINFLPVGSQTGDRILHGMRAGSWRGRGQLHAGVHRQPPRMGSGSAMQTCRSSVTISRLRSVRRSSTAFCPACLPRAASRLSGPISSTPAATPIS
jgi:hypothetical protein